MNYSTFEMPELNVKRLKTDLILNYKRLGVAGIVGICAIAHSELLCLIVERLARQRN